ncbi:MAG: glucose 1-dehydrogenase [Planctomycetota bacterium]
MDHDFTGKVAVVTGGGRGIGRAIAEALRGAGAAVVLAEIDRELGAQAAEELGERVHFIETDVASEPAVSAMIQQTVAEQGRLDMLINNAGISRSQPVSQLPLDDWDRVIGVNLTGSMLTAKHAGKHLSASHGSIVNIASTRALMSEADTEAYAASKGGLVALTHALAISLGPDVRVNCVSPGWIRTGSYETLRAVDHDQHPAGRVGKPEDVAAMVLQLCSGEAGFITGQNFVVDGGMTRKMIYQE